MRYQGRIISSVLIVFMCHYTLLAQTAFKYRSALPKIDSSGYYRINLQPVLTAKAMRDLADLRIVSDSGFIPYIKNSDLPSNNQSKFIIFPQVKTNDKTDTSTVFVVKNPTDAPVHQLWVRLKNTAVERHITLTGSDDLRQWFAISENISMSNTTTDDDKGIYQMHILFPASSYRFLKIVIDNNHKSPVNIKEAGIYIYMPAKAGFASITPLKFTQTNTADHITHLYISFDQAYVINKLHIAVTSNAYFHREINVYDNGVGHKWLTSKTFSNEDPNINLSVQARSLDVQIINNDDRPLNISHIEAGQTQSFIVARLEANKSFYLIFGNDNASIPKYDLRFFAKKIGVQLPQINHLAVGANPAYKASSVKPDKEHPYLLWVSICAAILILTVLTIRMAKEISKKNERA